jgi:hypothetical protein
VKGLQERKKELEEEVAKKREHLQQMQSYKEKAANIEQTKVEDKEFPSSDPAMGFSILDSTFEFQEEKVVNSIITQLFVIQDAIITYIPQPLPEEIASYLREEARTAFFQLKSISKSVFLRFILIERG